MNSALGPVVRMYTMLLVCPLPKQDLIQEATQECTHLTHVGHMYFMTEGVRGMYTMST